MKKNICLFLIIAFIAIITSFQTNPKTATERIQANYAENVEALRMSIDTYLSLARAL